MSALWKPDAASVLRSFVHARHKRPFAWGESDCAVFAFDAVHALIGRDVVADIRRTYSTALGAMRVLVAHGGLTGLADSRLGPRFYGTPTSGQVVLLDERMCDGDGQPTGALGIVMGRLLVAQGPLGVVCLPMPAAVAA